MKFLTKLIISTLVVTPVAVGASTIAIHEVKKLENNTEAGETFVVEKYGKKLTVDKKNLQFQVQKGDQIWKSCDINPEDNINDLRKSILESPITVYYYTPKAAENYFSVFDSRHINYTSLRFRELSDGFQAKVRIQDGRRNSPNLLVDVTYQIRLNEKGISLKVTEIEEHESVNKLSKLVFYPAFDSSYKLNDGFTLIPDGSGAIIDLSKQTSARSVLNLDVYDSDIGIKDNNRKPTTSQILSLPMYANNVGNRSTLVYVTNGDEYASLSSKTSGIIDNYNYTYFSFKFREDYYKYQGINESNRKSAVQEKMNDFLPEIQYELYDEKLDYSDFARLYRDYLISSELLSKSDKLTSDTRLEFLMSENKKAMFGREVIPMTSTNFVNSKAKELKNDGLDISVSLQGYTDGGLSNSYPNCFPTERKTGSEDDYKNLAKSLKSLDVPYTFTVDLVRSYADSDASKNDLAMNMSQKYIKANDYNHGNDTVFNHLTLNQTTNRFKGLNSEANKYKLDGFDFLSLGNKLYSSYYNQKFSRTDAKNKYSELVESLNHEIGLRKPNQYMFKGLDNYLEAPNSNSGFLIETSSVPFLSMVLSGYKNLYTTAINLNYTGEEQILSLIDYNINPTFLLTNESAIKLLDTTSEHIFSSKYSDWVDDIKEIYGTVNSTLKNVVGAQFISREEIQPNVFLNTYSNGKKIVCNYSKANIEYENKIVGSLKAEVF